MGPQIGRLHDVMLLGTQRTTVPNHCVDTHVPGRAIDSRILVIIAACAGEAREE